MILSIWAKALVIVRRLIVRHYIYLTGKYFIPISIWVVLESFKKNFEAKKSSIVRWWVKKNSDKEYEHVIRVWVRFYMKVIKEKSWVWTYFRCRNVFIFWER